jgi:hypothetical protein
MSAFSGNGWKIRLEKELAETLIGEALFTVWSREPMLSWYD